MPRTKRKIEGRGPELKSLRDLADQSPEVLAALKAANRRKLWMEGSLRYLTRPHGQRQLYDHAQAHMLRWPRILKPLKWLCHRRMGKSFCLLLMCFERAIRQKGAIIKYCCATRKQVRDIVEPMIGYILAEAPGSLIRREKDDSWYFRKPDWPAETWSRVQFVGLDYKQGDLLRGPACDLCCIDEARDISCLDYVYQQVLVPQFSRRLYPLVIMASTPPESMEHPFVAKYCEAGWGDGTTRTIRASENEDWTLEDDQLVIDELGGRESLAYQREIECKLVGDPTRQVIPEWDDVKGHTVVEGKIERPDWYIPYVSLDTGWKDRSAVLFSFFDFDRRKLCHIGEIFENYITIGQLAEMIWEKYRELFSPQCSKKARFVADGDLLEINTLRIEHSLPFMPAEKWRKRRFQAINAYRTALVEGLHEVEAMSCPHFVRQHAYGIYNKQRSDFDRSETMGHLDVVAAAVYVNDQVNWKQMARPVRSIRDNMWAGPAAQAGYAASRATQKALGKMFGSRFRSQ